MINKPPKCDTLKRVHHLIRSADNGPDQGTRRGRGCRTCTSSSEDTPRPRRRGTATGRCELELEPQVDIMGKTSGGQTRTHKRRTSHISHRIYKPTGVYNLMHLTHYISHISKEGNKINDEDKLPQSNKTTSHIFKNIN